MIGCSGETETVLRRHAAGLTSRGTLLDTTPELFDAHIAVNLRYVSTSAAPIRPSPMRPC
jgi:hypothetical protein